MMVDSGALVQPHRPGTLAAGSQKFLSSTPVTSGLLTKIQSYDPGRVGIVAGDARFACLLENIVSRAILPDVSTENLIEKTRSTWTVVISAAWNNYRYPVLPFARLPPVVNFNTYPQAPIVPVSPVFDDAFRPLCQPD